MPDTSQRIRSAVTAAARSYTVILVIALLIGVLLAPMAYGSAMEYRESTDKVATISVPPVIAPQTADPVIDALEEARQNESIEAVVLEVNTPGGALSATEELALEVERTAEEMPVVVSVGQMAASGGYYVSAPADEIYANPSAMVGSVGVNFAYLDAGTPTSAIQSGPDKSGGYTEAEAIRMADVMVEGFYGMVLDHRGDELTISKEELSYAKVYPSQRALHNGMIDEIGTTETAIQRAAELAGMERYEVVELDATPEFGPLPIFSQAENGDSPEMTDERVVALIDPAPGVSTPVPLALYGTLSDERTIATTAGEAPVTAVNENAQSDSEVRSDV
jgi:protease-4